MATDEEEEDRRMLPLSFTAIRTLQEIPGDSHPIMGYIGLGLGGLFILVLALLTIRYLIFPGEKEKDHIKRRILDESRNPKERVR